MASSSPSPLRAFAAPLRLVLWLLVFVGAGAGVRSAMHRWNAEKANQSVEIAVDYSEVRTLAAASGVPVADVLKQFKAAGVVSVAVQEETVGGANEEKQVTFDPLFGGETALSINAVAYGAGTAQEFSILRRVEAALRTKTRFSIADATPGHFVVNAPWQAVRGFGIGLNPETVAQVRGAGLGIVGRVGNYSGVSPSGLSWTLGELKKQGVSTVLFSGDEVLGYKGYVAPDKTEPTRANTADVLRSLRLFDGAIEFGKQKGDAELTKAAPDRVVRVHTITGGEMLTMTVPDAVQRFSLAARERNMRLLFVRLFLDEPDAIAFNTDYVGKIATALKRGGLTIGTAHGYGELGVGFVPRLLMGLATGAAFLLLADAVTRFFGGGVSGWLGTGFWLLAAALAGLAASPSALGVKLAALGAALVFPSLALLYHDLLRNDVRTGAWGRFFWACFVTLLGVACVVGLLAGREFLVKADAFVGIKATLAVPVVLAALVYALDLRAGENRTFAQAVAAIRTRLLRLSAQPVLVWQIIAATLALLLFYIILSRSGNEGVGVSGIELKLRGVLDRYLGARPRFKDVFGHAAMVASLLTFARTRRRDWALPLFVLGVFGQVSLLNTFCHLHTPLAVSLWRAGLGAGIGLALGAAAFALLDRFVLRPYKGLWA